MLVDFEGEPARPLEERRNKHSPLRDVAGMIRSFSYAAAVAFDKATGQRPADEERVAAPLTAWRQQTVETFVAAYRAGIQGCVFLSGRRGPRRNVCSISSCSKKTLYEVRYELDNRPDWVRIPLAGLMQQLLGKNS